MKNLVLFIESENFLFYLHLIDISNCHIFYMYLCYQCVNSISLFLEGLIELIQSYVFLLRLSFTLF